MSLSPKLIGALLLAIAFSTANAQSSECSKYDPVVSGGRRATIFYWTNNGGTDSEWMNVNNWNKYYLPGSVQNDRLIMAVNDKATVTCPATDYMSGNVRLEMRAKATLDVSSDLKIGDYLRMDSGAVVTQTLGGTVSVGTSLTLADSAYNLMTGASLEVGGDMTLNANSNLSVQMDMEGGTSFSADNLTLNTGSTLHIELTLEDQTSTSTSAAGIVRKSFTVNNGKLAVDASAYSSSIAGTVRIPLIKFDSIVGEFSAGNIVISGLPETASTEIDVTSSSLELVVSSTGTSPNSSPTKAPTNAPTKSPTNAPTKAPTKSPTSSPVQSPQTSAPVNSPPITSIPTAAPVTSPTSSSAPTKAPVTTKTPTRIPTESPTSSPTSSPTDKITSAPTVAPVVSPTITPAPSPTVAPVVTSTEIPTGSPVIAPSTENPTRPSTERPTAGVCSDYPVISGGTRATAFYWYNPAGEDPEWLNVNNWYQTNYLPGSRMNDIITLASGDKAKVTCPASTYMAGDIAIKMRGAATLDVTSSDFKIGNWLRMDGRSVVTQMGPSGNVNVGTQLTVTDSTYKLLGGDVALNVGKVLTLNADSKLILQGEGSSFTAESLVLTSTSSTIDMTLGQNVPVAPGRVRGAFYVNGGRLTIDATSYSPIAGVVTKIPLIEFGSMVGIFAPENLVVSGLSRALSIEIEVTANSLNLVVDATSSSHPSAFTIDSTIYVSLTANGYDPTIVGDRDVVIDSSKAGLVIDGSDYTIAGPRTIPILDWRGEVSNKHTRFYSRLGEFDPKKIELRNFDKLPGLWFELQYGDDYIQLVIKYLVDYSEYSQSSTRSYTNSGVYPDEPDTSRFPEYSWKHIPRWTNARKNTAYTPAELDILANNNTIVKVASTAGLPSLEEGSIATAGELRKLNENLKLFCYWNSFVYWGTYRASATFGGNSWLRYDENGQLINLGTASNKRYAYNHDVPAMRQWWTKTAVDFVSESVFDGIFIDKAADPRNQMTTGHRLMITELANELPSSKIYIGNALRQMSVNGARDRLAYMDGSYMENWTQGPNQAMSEIVTVSIQLAREALSKGKMLWWTSGPWGCGWPCNVNEQEFAASISMPLAIFLMIVEPNAYFNYQKETLVQKDAWKWDSSRLPEFEKSLGAPKGPPIKVGNKFARQFEHLTVEVDMDAETAILNWHEDE